MKSFLLFFFLFTIFCLFSREIPVNQKCASDNKLLLEKIVLNEDNTILYFFYKNDDNARNKIGLFPPESLNSYYIEDIENKQKYHLIDVVGLPKWFPQQVKYLKRYEEVNFHLIFPPIPATLSIHIIEGEGNEESNSAWNFKNVEIADAHVLNNLLIEIIQKESRQPEEERLLQTMKGKYEHIADFLTQYPSGNWDAYLLAWRNEKDAAEIIDFIHQAELEQMLANIETENAMAYIQTYPFTTYRSKLEDMISQKTKSIQQQEYEKIKEKNIIHEYIDFIKKYCVEDCENSSSEFVRDAVERVKAFFDKKQKELKRDGIIENYHATLEMYSDNPYAQNIVEDYDNLAETAFGNSIETRLESDLAEFVLKFPFSHLADKAWQEINKRYVESNTIEIYQKYLNDYPHSPYYSEMQAKLVKLEKDLERKKLIEENLESIKASLKSGDKVSYLQTFRVKSPSNDEDIFVFEIRFWGTIIHVLTKDVRIRVTDSEILLNGTTMNSTIQDYYDQMSSITVGGTETVPISRLDSFPTNDD